MILKGVLALLTACASMAVGGAWAQQVDPALVEGCTQYLSVQHRGCLVSHHYQCDAPAGSRRRIDFTPEGAIFMSAIDGEAQWIESRSLVRPEWRETLFPTSDAASISTLLAEGYDDFTFEQRYNGARVLRHEGFDRLTGERFVIDGEELLGTEYFGRLTDPTTGQVLDEVSGREYVSARHRRFFAGIRAAADGGEPLDNTPAKFFYPGDDGFEAVQPRYDCGPLLSGLPMIARDQG